MIALTEIELYTPYQVLPRATLLIEGSQVRACGATGEVAIPQDAEILALPGLKAFPGFIDLHIHGLLGNDAMGADLAEVIRALPRFGVTSFLATTVTLPIEEVYARLEAMAAVLEDPPLGATCLGIHLEGPHLSPKRAGMATAAWFHSLTWEEFEAMQGAAHGHIRMITFAPEEADSMRLIPTLRKHGVIPAIGHSDATYEQVAEAVKLGLAHASHTFNAMSPFHHRAPGVVGAVMAFPEITAELIADGHHVHPGAMRALFNAKGVEGVCLISDASPFAALPDGEYRWKEYTILIREGTSRLPDSTLAGAHALMDTGFRHLIQLVGLTPSQASVCASFVPARVLGLTERKGRLEAGFDADIVLLDEEYRPRLTMIGERILWRAE